MKSKKDLDLKLRRKMRKKRHARKLMFLHFYLLKYINPIDILN